MNTRALRRPLIALGLLALAGAVGAQSYYTRELAQRVAAQEPAVPPVTAAAPASGPWDPWSAIHADMMRMQAQMDRMFDSTYPDLRTGGFNSPAGGGKVTLEAKGDDYVVKADIPGAKEGDINVNLDGRLLSISSQTRGNEQQTADNGQVVERGNYTSDFQEAFTLPGPVNASGMHSRFDDGVLTVTIPKAKT